MPTVPATKKLRQFDPATFLATIGEGRRILELSGKQAIFTQGDKADAIFYIQKGKVKLTVLSKTGREATIAILGEGKFFGEGALAGQGSRMGGGGGKNPCGRIQVAKSPRGAGGRSGRAFFPIC